MNRTEFTRLPAADIRGILSANLHRLVGQRSVSQLTQELGINRTQFNRYLYGQSFPRPDVLARICDFFGVDGNILLRPLPEHRETLFQPAPVPDGRVTTNGRDYMADAKGALVPVELIKGQDLVQDAAVRKIVGFALALSDQVARFKEHTFEDIGAVEVAMAEEYDATLGGAKGNKTLMSFDGLMKVQVQVADYIDFGPQLQIAKGLVDECLNEWAADARAELRAIVTRAFNTDKAGQINRSEIFMLLRLEIADPRWKRAMEAIRDAMRVVGSKTYVRCYRRDHQDGAWQAITIDLAKA